jgi:hypothetical protein
MNTRRADGGDASSLPDDDESDSIVWNRRRPLEKPNALVPSRQQTSRISNNVVVVMVSLLQLCFGASLFFLFVLTVLPLARRFFFLSHPQSCTLSFASTI